jgi:hypothetical protein
MNYSKHIMKTILSFILSLFSAGLFAQPNWAVKTYTNSTTAYGIVIINGSPAAAGDRVGAFVDNECRANDEVILPGDGKAYISLQIQGEVVETVSFKVWDASDSKELNVALTIQSSPGSTIGSPPNYLLINAVSTYLNITPSNQNIPASPAGQANFTVTSNLSWTAVSDQTWCTVTPSGSGNGTITASYSANATTSQRVATITVTASGVTPVTVTVTQAQTSKTSPDWAAKTYTNSTTAYGIVTIDGIPAVAGDRVGAFVGTECRANEEVILPGDGKAYVSLQIQGEVVESISFKVWDASDAKELNVAFTILSSPGNTIGSPPNYLLIDAISKYLNITPSNQNVPASPAGQANFTVTSNLSWTAVSDQTWCTVTPSGSGNGTITAKYSANAITSQRVATITVTAS